MSSWYAVAVTWHIVIQLIGFAIILIQLTKVYAGTTYVEHVEESVSNRTAGWTNMVNQMSILAAREDDAETKKK